jgi:hypothetical protein
MSNHCCDECEAGGSCPSCDLRRCEALGEELREIDSKLSLMSTLIGNQQSIRDIGHRTRSRAEGDGRSDAATAEGGVPDDARYESDARGGVPGTVWPLSSF